MHATKMNFPSTIVIIGGQVRPVALQRLRGVISNESIEWVSQCSIYHRAFTLFYPAEAATGTTVRPHGQMLQSFNALSEATLMFIRHRQERRILQAARDIAYDRTDTLTATTLFARLG